MAPIDQVQLHFNPQTLQFLNAVLGLVMFGVALDLKIEDFRSALKTPKALALGLFGHHVLFPAMTYVLVWILQPQPSIALGMILVSSCLAGHISNFLVHFSRGNTALSVSVSALSTLTALVMTPLNFAFWGNLSPVTSGLMKQVAMSPWEMLEIVVLLLGVPLKLANVEREGIRELSTKDVVRAQKVGEVWKMVGWVERTPDMVKACVRPIRLPQSHPLASVSGATNAVTFVTKLLGDVTIIGPGAGRVAQHAPADDPTLTH